MSIGVGEPLGLPLREKRWESVPTDPAGMAGNGRNQPEAQDNNMSPEVEKTRREFLEEAVHQDPHNTFARYGLALELAKSEPANAWIHFEYLLLHHPEYAATYFQAGIFLMNQGRLEEARKVLSKGVEITGHQGKQHAQAELQAALDDLD
jgi:tetratricopeptide (TPR) repeat protein